MRAAVIGKFVMFAIIMVILIYSFWTVLVAYETDQEGTKLHRYTNVTETDEYIQFAFYAQEKLKDKNIKMILERSNLFTARNQTQNLYVGVSNKYRSPLFIQFENNSIIHCVNSQNQEIQLDIGYPQGFDLPRYSSEYFAIALRTKEPEAVYPCSITLYNYSQEYDKQAFVLTVQT